MNYHDIVLKLIGPIEPVGETNTDNERLENLIEITALVDLLIGDIDKVIAYKNRNEFSMKRAGEYADNFFTLLGITE